MIRLLIFCLLTAPIFPATVFSNLLPGDVFQAGVGWSVGNGWQRAHAFTTPVQTYALTGIDIAISDQLNTGATGFTLYLYDNVVFSNGSMAPGQILETLTYNGPLELASPNLRPLISLTASGSTLLAGSTIYWIALEGAPPSAGVVWNTNALPTPDGYARVSMKFGPSDPWAATTGAYETGGAFRVNGDAASSIPEPGTLQLACVAAVILIGRLRRRGQR